MPEAKNSKTKTSDNVPIKDKGKDGIKRHWGGYE